MNRVRTTVRSVVVIWLLCCALTACASNHGQLNIEISAAQPHEIASGFDESSFIVRWQDLIGSILGSGFIVLAALLSVLVAQAMKRRAAASNLYWDLVEFTQTLATLESALAKRRSGSEPDEDRDLEDGDDDDAPESLDSTAEIIQAIGTMMQRTGMLDDHQRGIMTTEVYPPISPNFHLLARELVPATRYEAGLLRSFMFIDRHIRESIERLRVERAKSEKLDERIVELYEDLGRDVKLIKRLAEDLRANLDQLYLQPLALWRRILLRCQNYWSLLRESRSSSDTT